MKSGNWVQQHPNGTAVIALLIGFAIAGFGSLDAAESVALGLGRLIVYFVDSKYLHSTKELVLVLISLGLCLPVLGWTFKQTQAPKLMWLGWIMLSFLPFGWVVAVFIGRPVVKVLSFGRPIIVPPDSKGIFDLKYWRGTRQSICWAGIIALVELVVLAWTLNDYSQVPLWARVGQSWIPYVVGGFLLYGALRE
jgi:hypothetical protein